MALGTNHVTNTTADVFIPEIWSDEVIASFKENLVLANRVTRFNHQGKKGDTIHIPNFTRADPTEKAASQQVTLITNTETDVSVTISEHWEYSVLIEDITEKQALDSYRMAYTDDAGHSLSRLVDRYLFNKAMAWQGGTAPTFDADNSYANSDFGSDGATATVGCVIGGDGSTIFDGSADNATDITDVGLRQMILTLDNADVPQSERSIVLPPVAKKDLLGIARYTEQAFVGEAGGGNSIRNGLIGDLYGIPVYVSTNCPTDESSVDSRMGVMFHRSALVLATQMDIRIQTQYKQEYLADLFTADNLFGALQLRTDAGVCFAIPAA